MYNIPQFERLSGLKPAFPIAVIHSLGTVTALLNPDTLLYLTLLMLVWIVPLVGASWGLIWASLYVLLQWCFVSQFELSDNSASIVAGLSLLGAYLISFFFWEDPFSKARITQFVFSQLRRMQALLESLGIKPEAQILDYQDYRQVNHLSRLLKANQWAAAENFLRALKFTERVSVIEGIIDDPESELAVRNWLQIDSSDLMAIFVSAQLNIKTAWDRRGSGVPKTVTREGSHDFHYLLEQARTQYIAAIELDDSYAESYLGLITIAMGTGENRDKLYRYFARAVTLSNDRYEVHLTMINALSEKWGGGPDEALDLASRVLHRSPSNSPLAGIIAVAHIEHWLYLLLCGEKLKAKDYFMQSDVIAELEQAYSRLDRSQLESIDHIQALNSLAFCFYMGDHYVPAKRIFKQLNGSYVVYPWQYCTEPGLSLLSTGYAIDLVADRLSLSTVASHPKGLVSEYSLKESRID